MKRALETAADLKSGAVSWISVMVVMALMTFLFVAVFSGITVMSVISRRSADIVAGVELVEAKIHEICAVNYSGTNGVFSATATTTNINNVSVDLNQAGASLVVPGTVISTIQPIAWGHLVTVQVIIREPKMSLTSTLQMVLNNSSGGRGQLQSKTSKSFDGKEIRFVSATARQKLVCLLCDD